MKKQYIEPTMKIVAIKSQAALLEGSLHGAGMNMKINDSAASSDADSRRGISWDDEDE